MNKQVREVGELNGLRNEMIKYFEQMNSRFEQINVQFKQINDQIDERFKQMEGRLDKIEEELKFQQLRTSSLIEAIFFRPTKQGFRENVGAEYGYDFTGINTTRMRKYYY